MAEAGSCLKHKCDTAAQTLEWINAIFSFIRPYAFLINSHVVYFYKDRLWEAIDEEWMDCLRKEPVENLLSIPSGTFQDYWPESLKKFILGLRSLVFPRAQADLQMVFPGLCLTSLDNVLVQGMNQKKKHEAIKDLLKEENFISNHAGTVEVLSAIVNWVANGLKSSRIVDVGAGQGYLAQVLSFHYRHSVIAIDACSHHGKVTDTRAERIKKYYMAQMRKGGSCDWKLNLPKTITCQIMSMDVLKALVDMYLHDALELPNEAGDNRAKYDGSSLKPLSSAKQEASLILAGLHACGDLSVMMLRTFLESKDVKAIISIGCCYNLLSEGPTDTSTQCGFPMSRGVRSSGLSLTKTARDLACQSAERWRSMDNGSGLHNFELHSLRAAFQLVLHKYYPEVVTTCPSIGRQGKALRRRQQKRLTKSELHHDDKFGSLKKDFQTVSEEGSDTFSQEICQNQCAKTGVIKSVDSCALFEKFSLSGLNRLGLEPTKEIDLPDAWKEAEQYADLVGPYWSLRAALGPLLETLILLDRLLFLQEGGSTVEALMLPIFDAEVSPRNVALIAKKCDAN